DLIFGHAANPTGPNQLIFYGPTATMTRLGVNTYSPSQAADIVGNIQFSGGLSANGAQGSSGQYLTSAGASTSPTWGSLVVPSTSWRLTGNIGSNPAINFIGTTDAQSFVIRTNAIERARIQATGQISVNTTTSTHTLQSYNTGTADETAAVFGNSSGATMSQAIGVWGRANTSASNTGTIAVSGKGSGNSTAGSTNVALQISQGEFTMGRTTENPSAGTITGSAATGSLYSQEGPSGMVELSLATDLSSIAPTSGVYQDMGTFTINNEYIASNSIILINVIDKINGGGSPDPNNSVYKVDVESRAAGSCVVRVGMIPFVTDPGTFQGSDYIKIGYSIINPGR